MSRYCIQAGNQTQHLNTVQLMVPVKHGGSVFLIPKNTVAVPVHTVSGTIHLLLRRFFSAESSWYFDFILSGQLYTKLDAITRNHKDMLRNKTTGKLIPRAEKSIRLWVYATGIEFVLEPAAAAGSATGGQTKTPKRSSSKRSSKRHIP